MTTKPFARLITLAVIVTAAGSQAPSAYTLKTAKWQSSAVPFYVNAANLDTDPAAVLAAVQFGAHAWTNQTNAAFSFYYAGPTTSATVTSNGKNEVFFRDASNGSAIATTYTYSSNGRIIDTDIVFWDASFRFFTGTTGCSGGLYVEDIATHEFGHALGLGHSEVAGVTMAPSVSYCSTAPRWLSEDDKRGAEALYPGGAVNTAPAVSISSPSGGVAGTEGASITFSGSATDDQDGSLANGLTWISSRDGAIGSGSWFQRVLSVGTHTVTVRVTDSAGATSEAKVQIDVSPKDAQPALPGFSLAARGYKVKGWQTVELTWTGSRASSVDVLRDGAVIRTMANTGSYTDGLTKKGAGTYSYVVCEAGTSTCTTPVRVVF